jgi:hypothetical protein
MGAVAKNEDSGLTPMEEQFASAIVAHGGKRKVAYLEVYGAGVAKPAQEALKIATRPHVMAYTKQLFANKLEAIKTRADRVIAETARIAFADPLLIYDEEEYDRSGKLVFKKIGNIPKDLRAAIKKVKPTKFGIEVEFHDKTRVLEQMSRRFGLLGDRKDAESQQVHVHLDMRGDAPIDVVAEVIEVRPATPARPADEPDEVSQVIAPNSEGPKKQSNHLANQPDLEF